MRVAIHGANCNVRELPHKYVDVEFEDEVMVTSSVIESLINSTLTGGYYALRIVTQSADFLETLRTGFGFTNGIYWSNQLAPPLDIVFQQLFPTDKRHDAANGDIIYHRGGYLQGGYTTPVGYDDGKNILVYDPYSQHRILNPAWGLQNNYAEQVEVSFSESVQDYLISNRLAAMGSDKILSGRDSFDLIINPYTDGVTLSGPKGLVLSTDKLVCFNGEVNIPYTEKCEVIGDWKIVSSMLSNSTMFIFTHQRKTYICVSDIGFIAEIAKLPDNSFSVVTPLGRYKNSDSVTTLNYFLQRGA
jgi:hypothetical protein